jgi:hypothetical protein
MTFANQLNNAQLDEMMRGKTLYLEEPTSGGEIVLWYSNEGIAMARLPSGNLLNGTWSIKNNLSCIVWSYSPKDSCSKLVKYQDRLELKENNTDRLLGTVTKISLGNSEGL